MSESVEQDEDEVKNLEDFTLKSIIDDVEFIVEEKSLHVSKLILTSVSPVFRRMFQSECLDSRLELPGKSIELFHQFLKSIYPCGLDVVTEENVFDILPLAEEYQVSGLKLKCIKRLIKLVKRNGSLEVMFRVLQAASLYGLEKVIEQCSVTIAGKCYSRSQFDDMLKTESQFSIPLETKILLRNTIIRKGMKW